MDRFLDTTLSGGTGDQYDPTHTRPLGYYDQTDLPFYYELATQFATSDTYYSPIPANTIPNRMYLFAATSYGHGYPTANPNDPVWQQPTIFRALTQAGITWRYYYQDNSVFLANWADWNDPQIQGNVRNISEWYNILQSPTADQDLPQVVFIERAASTGYDEHPGNNVQTGLGARTANSERAAHEFGVAGLGVHPDLGRRRRIVRSRRAHPGNATGRSSCPPICRATRKDCST